MDDAFLHSFTVNLSDPTSLLPHLLLIFPFYFVTPRLVAEGAICTWFCAFLPAVPYAWKVSSCPSTPQ